MLYPRRHFYYTRGEAFHLYCMRICVAEVRLRDTICCPLWVMDCQGLSSRRLCGSAARASNDIVSCIEWYSIAHRMVCPSNDMRTILAGRRETGGGPTDGRATCNIAGFSVLCTSHQSVVVVEVTSGNDKWPSNGRSTGGFFLSTSNYPSRRYGISRA